MKQILSLFFMFLLPFAINANDKEVVMHNPSGNNHDQIYLDPPYVTYDDNLNELYVYFGTSSTIDIECLDPTGTPYYYVYGEFHYGGYTATYTNLPAGYYTITIHSVYGYTYYGNFTVS
ncbi:MAG: hypothetical protein IJG81_11055 [Muribaculaceae bacterium]|nr:hypothetical protein [Muribaculaceae bacterium]